MTSGLMRFATPAGIGTMLRNALGKTLIVGLLFAVAAPGSAAPTQAASAKVETDAAYTLAPGDKLRITVYGAPALGGEIAVNTSGNVAMPLVGDIEAKGKTTETLSAEIRTKLAAGYVNDPRVTVEVLSYRSYYILGEVNKPGEFPYAENLTIQQAVAAAGGYTYRASKHSAFLRRAGGRELHEKLGEDPVYVRPGDTIRIGERYF